MRDEELDEDEGEEVDESPGERANRELIELLNELRVALPGVQVLFAFLLTVPFANGFRALDAGDRRVYFAAVLMTAAATMFLIAPTAHHRLRFRAGVKEHLLRSANVLTLIGLSLLALAMSAATYVITSVVYPDTWAPGVAGGLAAAFGILWFLLPFLFRQDRTTPDHRRQDRS